MCMVHSPAREKRVGKEEKEAPVSAEEKIKLSPANSLRRRGARAT
jgi:hypothetical protein